MMAREFLRNSHLGRAGALDGLQRPAEAVRDWDRAMELDTGSQRNSLRLKRALSLVRAGEHARSGRGERVGGDQDGGDAMLYGGACVCSLASAERNAEANAVWVGCVVVAAAVWPHAFAQSSLLHRRYHEEWAHLDIT